MICALITQLAPHTANPLVQRRGTNLPTIAFVIHRSIGNQWCNVDFHPWRSNLKLIIALPEQHYNYPSHSRQLCLTWTYALGGRAVRFGGVEATLTLPIQASRTLGDPSPTVKKPIVSLPSVGAKSTFSLSRWG